MLPESSDTETFQHMINKAGRADGDSRPGQTEAMLYKPRRMGNSGNYRTMQRTPRAVDHHLRWEGSAPIQNKSANSDG
jgi:hypothetical protein